jgi:hypothetical protein
VGLYLFWFHFYWLDYRAGDSGWYWKLKAEPRRLLRSKFEAEAFRVN